MLATFFENIRLGEDRYAIACTPQHTPKIHFRYATTTYFEHNCNTYLFYTKKKKLLMTFNKTVIAVS